MYIRASLVVQTVKNPLPMQETTVQYLGKEDTLDYNTGARNYGAARELFTAACEDGAAPGVGAEDLAVVHAYLERLAGLKR